MKDFLQLHLSLVLAAAVIAHVSSRSTWLAFGVVFVISFGMIEGAVMFFIKKRLRTILQEKEEFQRSLHAMTLDEARSQSLSAIASSIHCKPVVQSNPDPTKELPTTVSDIFSRYARIVFPAGDLLDLGSRAGGFIDVGRTYDGARLLVRETDQGLFESESQDFPTPEAVPDYPSVFHWIAQIIGR